MIRSIHYLRGISALFVVLFHMQGYLNNETYGNLGYQLFGFGNVGVDLFFVISGYIICLSAKDFTFGTLHIYAIKRAFRIYPVLIFSALLWYAFLPGNKDLGFLLRSIIPVQSNYNDSPPYFGFNLIYPAWTLTYEVAFYAIYALCFSLSYKHKNKMALAVTILLPLFLQLITSHGITMSGEQKIAISSDTYSNEITTLFSSPMFIDFSFGILIYCIFNCPLSNYILAFRKCSLCISLLVLFTSLGLIVTKSIHGHGPFGFGIFSALIVLSMLAIEKNHGIANVYGLGFLGNISYSLYMTHVLIYHGLDGAGILVSMDGVYKLVLMVFLSLVFSYMVHQSIEKPFIQLSRSVIKMIEQRMFFIFNNN
ncbi:TPA: acyltransferase [Citrobacter freundii]|nr:acyltransferase [Citrobacter freundii]HBZ9644937.1 acyltransferase [Citrobacter freundii]HCA0979707.1 acyltransferase [Citrobacter freundii]HCL5568337.1 acyltransferase [Citrobacter freundii]HED3086589.1 acyltransferase [Citrobacter freundii]